MPDPVIVSDVGSLSLRRAEQPAYNQPFDLHELYRDPRTGAEHYVVRYRAGTRARWHRHSAAHTMIVVAGELVANGQRLGRRRVCALPGGNRYAPRARRRARMHIRADLRRPFDLTVIETQDS